MPVGSERSRLAAGGGAGRCLSLIPRPKAENVSWRERTTNALDTRSLHSHIRDGLSRHAGFPALGRAWLGVVVASVEGAPKEPGLDTDSNRGSVSTLHRRRQQSAIFTYQYA